MIISAPTADLINQQVGNEFSASIQYISISTYFEAEALPELSAYFAKQAEEEHMHAMKFIKYLGDADADVKIPAIPAPKSEFESVEAVIQLAYDQEVRVTEQIKKIYGQANSENDSITTIFLQWFLEEQLEEMAGMDTLLKVVRRAGNDLFRVEEYIARVGHPDDGSNSESA